MIVLPETTTRGQLPTALISILHGEIAQISARTDGFGIILQIITFDQIRTFA